MDCVIKGGGERNKDRETVLNKMKLIIIVSACCFDNATVGDLFDICVWCLFVVHPIKNTRCNYWWIYMCWLLDIYKYYHYCMDFL